MSPVAVLDRSNITALLASGMTVHQVVALTGFTAPFVRRVARTLKRAS